MNDKDTANITDFSDRQIVKQAEALRDDGVKPERDLWPAIAERVRELPQETVQTAPQKNWMPVAMAASLMIAIGSLGFAGYTSMRVNQELQQTAQAESMIDSIEAPFQMARASYLRAIASQEHEMSPEVREVLRKNLKIIHEAADEIRTALRANPEDPFLAEALVLANQKELQLLNQMTQQGQESI